jgi:hypothetical protein
MYNSQKPNLAGTCGSEWDFLGGRIFTYILEHTWCREYTCTSKEHSNFKLLVLL